jgi:hypothetical protein
MLKVDFTTDLGHKISGEVETMELAFKVIKHYGSLGWYSGEIPNGGFQQTLAAHPNFDWSVIGGKKYINSDGEEIIFCRGHAWKRRDFEEVNTKKLKMPAAIKYSRGAKPTDPESIVEKSDGDVGYVTLIMFRGAGKFVNDFYQLKPSSTQT